MRLLPWTGEGGQPVYLSTDGGDSFVSRFADGLESVQLRMAERLLHNTESAWGDRARIEVHDADESKPERREPSTEADSGRGLLLVDALTGGRWGVSDREGVGKLIWAECAADSSVTEVTR